MHGSNASGHIIRDGSTAQGGIFFSYNESRDAFLASLIFLRLSVIRFRLIAESALAAGIVAVILWILLPHCFAQTRRQNIILVAKEVLLALGHCSVAAELRSVARKQCSVDIE